MNATQRWSIITSAFFFAGLQFFAAAQSTDGIWLIKRDMPSSRQELATAALNGKVYVIGGFAGNMISTDTVEVYDPSADTWASAQPIPFPNNHNSAAVASGRLYSFGGLSNAVFVYDLAADNWSAVAPMNFEHDATPTVGVIDDQIYVAGGVGPGMRQTELERYDPATNTWTILASMHVPRNHSAGGVINRKLYVAGGRGSPDAATALEVYDPQTNTWQSLAPMPTARSGIAGAVVNGELFIFGGELPDRVLATVEAYNPATNTWRSLPDMPTARHGIWASVIGANVYLPGGATDPNIGPTNVNEVFSLGGSALFGNISTRARVETGDNVMIGGLILSGTGSKQVLVRALGPTLAEAPFNVPNTLADPIVELHDSTGAIIATNDNWQDASNASSIPPGYRPSHETESVILASLTPGEYTAIVRGVNDTTGIALVEIYDLESSSASKLRNISTRSFVQRDDNVMIGGFILAGNQPGRVLVRAIGPALSLPGSLPDPTLSVFNAQGTQIAANDNWRSSQQAEILATGLPPPNDLEAAVVLLLAPGAYTAIVSGHNATTGIALVEVYALD